MSEINHNCQSSYAFVEIKLVILFTCAKLNKSEELFIFLIVVCYTAFDARTARCQSNNTIVQIDCDHV